MKVAPNTSGVYYILNLKNDRIYVGESIDIASRWLSHRSDLRAGCHKSRAFQSDWDAFGEASFEFGILTTVHIPHRDARARLRDIERIFTHAYQSNDPFYGYNDGNSEAKRLRVELRKAAREAIVKPHRPRKARRKPTGYSSGTPLHVAMPRRQRRKGK